MTRAMILTALLCLTASAAEEAVIATQAAKGPRPEAPSYGTEAVAMPQMLSYQGRLTDTLGVPVPDTTYSVRFRLYDVLSGGSPLWSETQQLRTKAGLFSVLLGSATPIDSMPAGGAAYVGMAIEGGSELTPRLRIASAAYAYLTAMSVNSDRLQGKDTAAFAVAGHNHDASYVNEGQTNSVTTTMVVDGSITGTHINRMGAASGQVLKWTGSAWGPGNDSLGVGGGTVTKVVNATGVVCSPNPITDSGTVRFDTTWGDTRFVNEGQANSVTGAMIVDGTVSSTDIRDTTVNTADLKDNAVTSLKILDGGVTAADIRDTTVNTADLKDASVTMTKINQAGAATGQVIKWTGSAWAPRNDSIGSGTGDNAWMRSGSDSVLYTVHPLGIARSGATLLGNKKYTHINFGVACTTGTALNDSFVTISGGRRNRVAAPYGTIGGGFGNLVTAENAVVAGGDQNRADSACASVAGGSSNEASNVFASILGGESNRARGTYAVVGGGCSNDAYGYCATVAGGISNDAESIYSTVCGGDGNYAVGCAAFVGGGEGNGAEAENATIAGGDGNQASGYCSTIGGGYANHVTSVGQYGTIGGGTYNYIDSTTSTGATIGGGEHNSAFGSMTTVGGGYGNRAGGSYASVGGGYADTSAGDYGFTTGNHSVVPSSYGNSAAFNGEVATASNQLRCGTLSKAGGSFTIDHPLDPYGKILNHYFVESPDMSNLYSGSIVLSAEGLGEVLLPDYFETLNRNPRVQLTGVGTSEVYVAEDVGGCRFVVGGKPGAKVYWQVTGDRKDVSAEVIRRLMPVEQPKTGALAGRMLDDDFLAGCMDQLMRDGSAQGIDFRTAAGRQRYEDTKHARTLGRRDHARTKVTDRRLAARQRMEERKRLSAERKAARRLQREAEQHEDRRKSRVPILK